jgi:DNA-binding response OmpR family regulator
VGDLHISTWNQTVRRGTETLNLTPTEFRVLVCLAQQAGHVMSYQQIVQCAQGYAMSALEAAELIKPHMYHLRQKLEPDPTNPRYILTVRGTGYMLSATPSHTDE